MSLLESRLDVLLKALSQTDLERTMDGCRNHLISIRLTQKKSSLLFEETPRIHDGKIRTAMKKLEGAGKSDDLDELKAALLDLEGVLKHEDVALSERLTIDFDNRLKLLRAYQKLNMLLGKGLKDEIEGVIEQLGTLKELSYTMDDYNPKLMSKLLDHIVSGCKTINARQDRISVAIRRGLSLSSERLLDRIILGGKVSLETLSEKDLSEIRQSRLNKALYLLLSNE